MTFAHIPVNGFEISRARLVEIRDSLFSRVSPRSVIVEKSEKVNVAYNQMNINAFEAVYATDGSHLHISCNRILRRPISPDCSRTSTTTSTTTTTTTTTPLPPPIVRNMDYDGPLGSKGRREEDTTGGISGEMIGGIVVGILVVVAVILLFILVSRRRQQDKPLDAAKNADLDEKIEKGDNAAPATTEEKEALLPLEVAVTVATSEDDENRSVVDDEDVELRPKFASPIWIEEIQKNKIFNRQKSLLSEESIKDLANGQPHLAEVEEETVPEPLPVPLPETGRLSTDGPTPPPPFLPEDDELQPPAVVEEDTTENPKSESDEDRFVPQKQQQPQLNADDKAIDVKVVKPKVFETDI